MQHYQEKSNSDLDIRDDKKLFEILLITALGLFHIPLRQKGKLRNF